MADRGGSGYAQLRGIAEELDQLRAQLARAKRPPGAEEEQRLMRQELAAIREHLRVLAEQLSQSNGPSEPAPPRD
jgi:DNA repair exonuclease SbcCD ATPase subunit